jgi:hypothetical protein
MNGEADDGPAAPPDDPVAAAQQSHAVLRYTTLRLALFFVAVLVLWLVRVRSPVLVVALALVLSGLASYVLLARQRDAMSAQLRHAQLRRRARSAVKAAREDAFQDAAEPESVDRSGVPPADDRSGVPPTDDRSGVPPTDDRSGVPPTDDRSGVPPTVA